MAGIKVKWRDYSFTLSPTFLTSIEQMSLSKEWDTSKKKAQATELTLPVTFHKELDQRGALSISDKIAALNSRVGKTGAIYVNGVRLAHAYSWRLVGVDASEVNNAMGVLDSAHVELTFRSIGWPKGKSYSKWLASMKKAATKKTKKKTTKKSKKKTNAQIAAEVIKGKWGKTAAVRKKKLTAAGYNYNAVMKIVNAKKKKK